MEFLADFQPMTWLIILAAFAVMFIIIIAGVQSGNKKTTTELQQELEDVERIRRREVEEFARKKETEMESLNNTMKEALEKLRKVQAKDLADLKLEQSAKLEMIYMEVINYAGEIRFETDQRKRVLAKTALDRAEKFPLLLGCIRAMRDGMVNIYLLLDNQKEVIDPELGEDESGSTLDFDELNKIFDSLNSLRRQFTEIVNENRIYVKTNEFHLPIEIGNYLNNYRRGKMGAAPYLAEEDLKLFDSLYADDVVSLTGDFYGFGKDEKVVKNISHLMVSRERDFRNNVLAKRGMKE